MSDDRDPPLFDALWSLSGMTTRNQAREDPAMTASYRDWEPEPGPDLRPDPTTYGLPAGHVYGSDDPPGGPPAPPLGQTGPHISGGFSTGYVTEPPAPTAPGPQALSVCPTCGTGVHPDRLQR